MKFVYDKESTISTPSWDRVKEFLKKIPLDPEEINRQEGIVRKYYPGMFKAAAEAKSEEPIPKPAAIGGMDDRSKSIPPLVTQETKTDSNSSNL